MTMMRKIVGGAFSIGVVGLGLILYGDHKIKEVIELKKSSQSEIDPPLKAISLVGPHGKPCNGKDVSQKVSGTVVFEDNGQITNISYKIAGLTPGMHGFHIHETADFSDECKSAGPHFNPHNVSHGGPEGNEKSRHLGDLGNIIANSNGVAEGTLSDKLVKLSGQYSVIGRSVVVHEDPDDLGLGGHELSTSTGNAGACVACGEICKKMIS